MKTVKLVYFKESGKYYSEGAFSVADTELFHETVDRARGLLNTGKLPGLVPGACEYHVLLQMEGAPPQLLMARLLVPEARKQTRREDLKAEMRTRNCENEACGLPLAEGHPGLYCDTQCAQEDA
jgi:hypothetical protein